ncbi:MAG TPA: GNAT family N-acetyltransferase [Chloroflexia bacterium]|nr:GNAT family N-acetyltransferase [Chloroflexia bacterium]
MTDVTHNSEVATRNFQATVRALAGDDRAALESLLMRAPAQNAFHLSALEAHGLAPTPEAYGAAWAVGVFREGVLEGALVVQRGTGCIYHTPGDLDTLNALATAVKSRATGGHFSLLSGHASQVAPLLPLIQEVGVGRPDKCYFRTLLPGDLAAWDKGVDGFSPPRLAVESDIERLIDFYELGFYSLARLPSRAAWRSRLTEQLALRTLYIVEDKRGGVASAALSSAEGGGVAMLGGVATLPEYVGKGLSTLCVGALCAHLLRKGMDSISLFYLQDNGAAGRVYDKLGFRNAGEWLLAPLGYFGL